MKPKNTIPLAENECVCGKVCKSPVGLGAHRRTCEAYKADRRARVDVARGAPITRTPEERDVAIELREWIEWHAEAIVRHEQAVRAEASAREAVEHTGRTLLAKREAAATIGLTGADAATPDAIRAWMRAPVKIDGDQ